MTFRSSSQSDESISYELLGNRSSPIFIVINGFLGTIDCSVIRCIGQALREADCSYLVFNFPEHGTTYGRLPGPSRMVAHLSRLLEEVTVRNPSRQLAAIAYSQGAGILYQSLATGIRDLPVILVAPAISLQMIPKVRLSSTDFSELRSRDSIVKDFGPDRRYTLTKEWLSDYQTWVTPNLPMRKRWAGIIEAQLDTHIPEGDAESFRSLFRVERNVVIANADHVFTDNRASSELKAALIEMIKLIKNDDNC